MVSLEYESVYEHTQSIRSPGSLTFDDTNIVHQAAKGERKRTQVVIGDITYAQYRQCANGWEVRIETKDEKHYKFDGFKEESQVTKICEFLKENFQIEVEKINITAKGHNWGDFEIKGNFAAFNLGNDNVFDFPLSSVSQTQIAKRQEISIQLKDDENAAEMLSEIRIVYAKTALEEVPEGEEQPLNVAEKFHQNLSSRTSSGLSESNIVVSFPEILLLIPYGKHEIRVFQDCIQLHGKSFSHTIEYSNILRFFLLSRDPASILLVICLNAPMRRGNTAHNFLIVKMNHKDTVEATLKLAEDDFKQYDDKLQPTMEGNVFQILPLILKTLSKKKVLLPLKEFENADGFSLVQCSYKAESGVIFPFKNGFLFIHKPVMYIKDSEISLVTFSPTGTGGEMVVALKNQRGDDLTFAINHSKEHYELLSQFMKTKDFKVVIEDKTHVNTGPIDEDDHDPYMHTIMNEDGGSESEDDDFDPDAKNSDESSSSSDGEESGSDISSSSGESEPDSEDEKPRKEKKEKKKVVKKKKSDSDESATKRPAKESKKPTKKAKKEKDPNEPKRPSQAYILFGSAKRPILKEQGIEPKEMMKKIGELWKAATEEEKAPFQEQYEAANAKYKIELAEYKKNNPDAGKKLKQTTIATKKSPAKKPASSTRKAAISAEVINSSDEED